MDKIITAIGNSTPLRSGLSASKSQRSVLHLR